MMIRQIGSINTSTYHVSFYANDLNTLFLSQHAFSKTTPRGFIMFLACFLQI